MKTRTYQVALGVVVAICLALAVALVTLVKKSHESSMEPATGDPVIARGPESAMQKAPKTSAPDDAAEPAMQPIQLSPQRLQQIGVTTATAQFKDIKQDLSVPGNVDIDEQRLAYVQTRYSGWIQNVFANATYQYVRKGQRLFTIYSPDLVSSEQEYVLARQNQTTFAHDAHGMAVQESGWLSQAAEERLKQYGISAQAMTELEQSGKVQREIAVESPVSGFITERNALPNAFVQPDTKLYTIADLSTVWVYANVFQNDVGRLKPGDAAIVKVDAYPQRTFSGRIDQILPQVDMATRTVRVRLVFPNPGVALKPGMYVNVTIAAPLGRQLVVPSSAVLQAGSRSVAFLDHGNGSLEPRRVEVGAQIDGDVVVLAGLKPGDKVVSSANFLVDSEAQLQSAIGNFSPPASPESDGTPPAAQSAPIQIDFSTEPTPPRKGANTVRVKLSAADPKQFAGAQVVANFFMPAMPAMGMAAEHANANLAEKGAGIFEGPLHLDSGGTWQVSITVQRNGQTIATKLLSVSATGGM